MKIVKYLLFLFLIFIIAASIYVATKEGSYSVEKEMLINAPKEFVFSQVNDFQNWEKWGPWASNEDAEVSLSGKKSGEGASISWRSDDRGDGSITTTKILENEQIDQEVKLNHSFGTSTANAQWDFQEAEEGTNVVLRIEGEMDFMEKLHWEMKSGSLEDYFAPMIEENLAALNEDINVQMQTYDINVHGETTYGGGYYMYSSASTRQGNVQAKLKELLPQIKDFMEDNSISDNGRPFILYHSWDDENGTALFSIGVPTPTKVVTPSESNVVNGYLPNQQVVRTTLRGDRKNLPEAWEATFKFIEENNLELPPNYKPFEVYITDEAEEEVPAFLITEIYIPVQEPTVTDTEVNTVF